jgi:hypothetical protein
MSMKKSLKISVSVLLVVLMFVFGAAGAFAAEVPIKEATASSFHPDPDFSPGLAIDGSPDTMWHSTYGDNRAEPPHWITLELDEQHSVTELKYLPRPDGNPNGMFTAFNVYVSLDNSNFTKVAEGTWEANIDEKIVKFSAVDAKYVKLESIEDRVGQASEIKIIGEKAAAAGSDDAAPVANPQTGDPGLTMYLLLALFSAAAFIIVKRLKASKN